MSSQNGNGHLQSFIPKDFKFSKVLGSFANGRQVACLLSKTDSEENSLVVVEKLPMSEKDVKQLLDHPESVSDLNLIFNNDIYTSYQLFPKVNSELNRLKTTIINPATEQHLNKYSAHETVIFEESYEHYSTVTKPFIKERQLGLKWVHNILDGHAEADRIVYNDPDPLNGFILLPDMKWDGKTEPEKRLYLMAIVRRTDLNSIRDLTRDHLPLLENLAQSVPKVILEKYGIRRNHIRIFFHYLPSYWHLHVHFVVNNFVGEEVGSIGQGGLWSADRAHFLSSVISNVKMDSSYYQKASITYSIFVDSPLYKRFAEMNQNDNEEPKPKLAKTN